MPKFEKIEYQPIPVSDLLVEMKNLSELMIDLAYSAALFNDKELAEDVIELESRIDTLAYLLDMEIMIAAKILMMNQPPFFLSVLPRKKPSW